MEWSIPKFPLDELCDRALTWLTSHGSNLTRAVSKVVANWLEVSTDLLVGVPPWLTIIVFALLAWRLGGRRIAITTAIGFAFLWNLRLWQPTLETIVLVTLSTTAALLIGIPIGIACGLSRPDVAHRRALSRHDADHAELRVPHPGDPVLWTRRGLGVLRHDHLLDASRDPPDGARHHAGPQELIEASDAFGSTPAEKLSRFNFRSRCRPSWPASTRPSCLPCPWS